MKQPSALNRGSRKRRNGKRKRNTSPQSEEDERKLEEPPLEQEKEKKMEEEEKIQQPWNCPACTFLNEATRCFCEMCETPNPSPSPAARKLGASTASDWSCAACTMVNPTAVPVCVVCGTLNPRPVLPPGLSIRLSKVPGGDGSALLSSSSMESDEDSDEFEEAADRWICKKCDTLSNGRTCSNCLVQQPTTAQKADNAAAKGKKNTDKKKTLLKNQKRQKREQERAKVAYGVSLFKLKKLMMEPDSSRLIDTLQVLTHTLAMIDASADNMWADTPPFLLRGFGTGRPSDTAKDPELLTALATIFHRHKRAYPDKARLLALQSINYLMKMDRHIFARAQLVEVVRLYIADLLAWKNWSSTGIRSSSELKNSQMIVEECLSGLSSLCSTEVFALRELLAYANFVEYLEFLLSFVNGCEEDGGFHPSTVMTALGILQKCCMKLRWFKQDMHLLNDSKKPIAQGVASFKTAIPVGECTLELARKLIAFLQNVLEHKHVPAHVKAAKCLLLIFDRIPNDDPKVIEKLVTSQVMRKLIAVVVKSNGEESDESRFAIVNLLLHLFDNHSHLFNTFVRKKIYLDLFDGMVQLLQSSSTALRTSTLRLMAMLTQIVCRRKHALGSASNARRNSTNAPPALVERKVSLTEGSGSRSPQSRRSCQRLNSLPDPNVLSTLLLEFIRNDSIAAVNVLLKDGADLNFPEMFDDKGNEIDKPLNVAVEFASLGMVRLLLKQGADVHQIGFNGTALHVAARFGRCDVASLLLQCGARLDAKDREDKTVMDVVNATDKVASEGPSVESIPSPMRRWLELHQRLTGLRDCDSDISESESDEMAGGGNRGGVYSSDHDDYGEDDDLDDDELDENEGYLMDYDDDDDEDEGLDDEEMDDEEMSSDEEMGNDDGDLSSESKPSDERRYDVILSGSLKSRNTLHNRTDGYLKQRHVPSVGHKEGPIVDATLEHQLINVTAYEVYAFSLAVTQCLLLVLHNMDIQKVEHLVMSTLACVLEMAPSQLIRDLKDADVALILDTVHFLLQSEKHYQIMPDAAKPRARNELSSFATAAAHSYLLSFILAIRILRAMVSKFPKGSSIFHQIERRGISEQLEQLNDASACWVRTSRDGSIARSPRDTTFERGLDLVKSLRADMMESGTLHLHKLRNLARRLKEFSEDNLSCDQELILVDLVDLFKDPNSITTYEFKQSQLLPAILRYLSPQDELHQARVLALMQSFECCPTALKHLIFRLQSIITQEETFSLITFSTIKGKELYPLTRQLKITFIRHGDQITDARQHGRPAGSLNEKTIQSSPLTHFQSFEKVVFRNMSVIDSDLSLLYLNLVGHSIQKVVEGKWRKYLVVGYDDTRSYHLLKSIGGTDDSLVEMVLHDSQCKLIGSVDVHENIVLDLELFGTPAIEDSGNKKKRKNSKRKRKLSTQKHLQAESDRHFQIEVQNTSVLKLPSLPGAWYAAVLWNKANDVSNASDGKRQMCEKVLSAQGTHSVKLLANNRIVRKVPADCIRPRTLQPQVGSIVDVDGGTFGEVIRIHKNDCTSGDPADILLDIKMNFGGEKKRVVRDRVQFPPQKAFTPAFGYKNDRIKAMSHQTLIPTLDNSLLAGSIGDRVWVLPPLNSSVQNLCVAGTIKNFPSGSDSIHELSTVVVEVAYGITQASLTIKVNQDRILNFGADGGILSTRSPSRLLAALQMASDRSRSSVGFSRELGGHNNRTSAIQRAFERVAGSQQPNGLGGALGSTGTAMDQLRNLLSRKSTIGLSNALSDVDISEQIQITPRGATVSSLPNVLIGNEVQTGILPSVAASFTPTDAKAIQLQKSNGNSASTLASYLKLQHAKPKMICSQLPKVNLVVGFRECDTNVTAPNRVVASSRFGLKRVGKASKDTLADPHVSPLDPTTQLFENSASARKALLEFFSSFSGDSHSRASQKKKRKKVPPPAQRENLSEAAPWDIEKFISFMQAVCGSSHPRSNAKHCITFSKFADPATNRKLLTADEFVALINHQCKNAVKSKQLVQFLRSRGYSKMLLRSDELRSSSRKYEEEKTAPSGVSKETPVENIDSKMMRQPVVLRGFPADQNVLKCMEELHCEYRAKACTSTISSGTGFIAPDTKIPPWKLTYKLYCDFRVEWEASNANTLLGSPASLLKPFASLESKLPMLHGIVSLDDISANGAADANRYLGQITGPQTCSKARDKIVVPDSVASAMRLLRYLFQSCRNAAFLQEALWTSPRLYNKLEMQMQDVLSMCSGIYPPWCDALVTHCKFFFPRKLRQRLFRLTSFGCTRSLHWFRDQLKLKKSSKDFVPSMDGGGTYNQEISISPIPKERVKVHRANILQSAEAVMKMHAKRKAILDVVFVGEKGYGSGVTAAFYSSTAHALQVVIENRTKRYWIPGEDDEVGGVSAEARQSDGADGGDGIADDATVIRHFNGLFPYPHRKPDRKLLDRFRLMGRLAGKALMDERLLPLPLSLHFMKLVVGESFGLEELGDIFLSHGRILYSMYKACQKLAAGQQNVQIDQMNIHEWLEAVGITFIDPFSQDPLVIGGDSIVVSISNLTVYVRAVLELWLDSGIRAQVLAFREGLSEVFPVEKLRLLFVPELLSLLCGEQDIKWNAESLAKDTKLAHGYTKDSQPVQWFFEVLEEMSATERRAFLLYATGCPNLPPGGFQALKPPFEVVRRVVDDLDVDFALPFARTCTNTLHLPAYSSKDVLANQMTFAIANSRGAIDRD